MLIDAMKSAGPKMIVSTRGDAFAMASIVEQPARVLDLRLDADPPDLEADRALDLGEQQVQRRHLRGRLHLRQHDAVEVGAGALDDVDDVAVGPRGRPVVDADRAHPGRPSRPRSAPPRSSPARPAWRPAPRRPPGRGTPGRRAGSGPCPSSSGSTPAPPGSSAGGGGAGRRPRRPEGKGTRPRPSWPRTLPTRRPAGHRLP